MPLVAMEFNPEIRGHFNQMKAISSPELKQLIAEHMSTKKHPLTADNVKISFVSRAAATDGSEPLLLLQIKHLSSKRYLSDKKRAAWQRRSERLAKAVAKRYNLEPKRVVVLIELVNTGVWGVGNTKSS